MKKAKKVLLVLLCALLLVGASVAGTLAYLTSTAKVENTFTVGKVVITMDESKVDEYGVPVAGAGRVNANEYKLIPGRTYTKDPIIHVATDSESCWLFVKIDKASANITLAGQDGWTQIGSTDYWAYESVVSAGSNVVVFNSFTYAATSTSTDSDAATSVVVTAYAIQADGFATSTEAWDALSHDLSLT